MSVFIGTSTGIVGGKKIQCLKSYETDRATTISHGNSAGKEIEWHILSNVAGNWGGPLARLTSFFCKTRSSIFHTPFSCVSKTMCCPLCRPSFPIPQTINLQPGTTSIVECGYLAPRWQEMCNNHAKENLSLGETNSE